jgi:hypothetical protein|eukprot:scaffold349_cov267-Chaetoceros_neogracile.AAC.40
MKSLSIAAAAISLIAASQTNAFAPSNIFGVKSKAPSTLLPMAVMPDGAGPNERDRNKPQASSESETSSSSPYAAGLGALPGDMTFPFEHIDRSSFSAERLERIQQENEAMNLYLHGDELIELRRHIIELEEDLVRAADEEDVVAVRHLTKALYESKEMDAEHCYMMALDNMEIAEENGDVEKMSDYRKEALMARSCLPQFQLSGLWVGKYGEHGYEMVNVTYVGGELGNILVASKVTGDKNVPKGEITFTSDLHPKAKGRSELEPIELSAIAAKQWGHKHLPRFPGKGQVAGEGFVNNQWMEGQLILVGEYFSFAWLPIGHQIFFGRPSAELTLKMLKQSQLADYGAIDSESPNIVAEQRAFAQRCLQETELMLYDDEADGELCFLTDDDDYFCQKGCFD